MPCYHPLKGFQIGLTENGKKKLKVVSYDVECVTVNFDGTECHCHDTVVRGAGFRTITDFIELPCGHCFGCRFKYARDWANRMLLEAKDHESTLFLTLTYKDEHLPTPNKMYDLETGEELGDSPIHPLDKRAVQLFMKRLRKQYSDQKIRFYACGEYGSESMRPHYHLILFGLKIDDLVYFKSNFQGDKYYRSQTIERLWPYGYHMVAVATWETMAYTARYVTKKLNGDMSEIYDRYNYPREFSLCSRKPGLARNYYDKHKDQIYENEEIITRTGKGAKKFRPPRYYDKLYDIDYPEKSEELKAKRKEIAILQSKQKMRLTDLSYLDMLQVEENALKERTKVLKRKEI